MNTDDIRDWDDEQAGLDADDDEFDAPMMRHFRVAGSLSPVTSSSDCWMHGRSHGEEFTGCNATRRAIRVEIMSRRAANGVSIFTGMPDVLELKAPSDSTQQAEDKRTAKRIRGAKYRKLYSKHEYIRMWRYENGIPRAITVTRGDRKFARLLTKVLPMI